MRKRQICAQSFVWVTHQKAAPAAWNCKKEVLVLLQAFSILFVGKARRKNRGLLITFVSARYCRVAQARDLNFGSGGVVSWQGTGGDGERREQRAVRTELQNRQLEGGAECGQRVAHADVWIWKPEKRKRAKFNLIFVHFFKVFFIFKNASFFPANSLSSYCTGDFTFQSGGATKEPSSRTLAPRELWPLRVVSQISTVTQDKFCLSKPWIPKIYRKSFHKNPPQPFF